MCGLCVPCTTPYMYVRIVDTLLSLVQSLQCRIYSEPHQIGWRVGNGSDITVRAVNH